MKAKDLKASILQQAIMGKLVPQDPNDEPASVLLERIHQEKQKLIKEGKLKKDKNESRIFKRDNSYYEQIGKETRCIDDVIPFDVPRNWTWQRWGTLSFSIQYGYNAPALNNGVIKMVRISDIQNGKVQWEQVPYCNIPSEEISKYSLSENDILFARTGGTVGKSFIVKELNCEAIYAGYLIRTRFSQNNLLPEYLKLFMESNLYWAQLRSGTVATAQPNCNGKKLAEMIVPIPPLDEQIRIVSKIEELLPFIKEYEHKSATLTSLETTFPDQLKKSILQDAIMGKLVPQYPNDEPAFELLKRIKTEKEKLINDGKLKRDKNESFIYKDLSDNCYYERIGKETRCIDDELPFDIPDNWTWCRIRNIGNMVRGNGIKRDQLVKEGLPCIRYGEIYTTYNRVFDDPNSFIQEELYSNCKKSNYGDILLTLTGENKPDIAKAIVNTFNTEIAISGDMLKWEKHQCDPYYLVNLMASPYVINLKIQAATGDIIVHISAEKISSFLIPLPPYQEQKRISAKIQNLLDLLP